ncbi:helix-turn-helix domain-containing protein [Arthrobacter gandavensis]|uniref:helix-turn-helix domain-containing protein n=1 Tax=Arthrobacter gandavensis TaxID=169960 RepID=UPI001E52BE54|nr:helix-turn-helix domain-containing protein [Arthrobacter gandavensis]
MHSSSSLSEEQREAAVALFELGWGYKSVAMKLGVSKKAANGLYDRWRVRGGTTLLAKPTKRKFSFEFKLMVVQRFLAGETKVALAQEFQLSSPNLIKAWVSKYRSEGEEGLRPKPKGRPKALTEAPARPVSELERLRRENERLRAEVAFLGKVQALRGKERR